MHDVIVVGAGPVGLSLALGLARAGREVLVLEKEPSTAEHSRAPAIWPRTQEILDDLGVIDAFLEEGIALREVRLWDADHDRPLLRLPLAELADETDYPQLLILPQSDTERLLRDALDRAPTARVLFSAAAVGVAQDEDGAEVTYRWNGRTESVRAPFVVGCDGAHSTVRDAIGVEFPGGTYRARAALADVTLDGSPDERFPRLSSRDRLVVGIRIGTELWRLILPFAPGEEIPLERRVARAVDALFAGRRHHTVWMSEFRLHRRIASRFVVGRVALAGDAAHLNSPVGGQGMNAGIRDAAVLTPILLRALEGGDRGALAGYERDRREEIDEGVNRFTDRLTRILLAGRGRFVKPVLRLADLTLRLPPVRRRLLRRLAMLRR